jgi:pimeloyl-ACP methyl ester carboxylesterase
MWLFLLVLATDSLVRIRVVVAPAETLVVESSGTGPPVVLLPGLFGSAFGYRNVVPGITAMGLRAIVIEPLAVGRSSRPRKADYSLTAQARRMSRVLDMLGIHEAVVVAHSVSSAIALRLASARHDQVKALILLEGGPTETAATPSFRRAMQYVPWVKWAGGIGAIRKAIRQTLMKSAGDDGWVTDQVITEYTAGAAGDLDGTLLAYLQIADSDEPESLKRLLPRIRCPIRLLIGGAPHSGGPGKDEIRRLTLGAADVVVDTVPGAGHYLHEERADFVTGAIGVVAERTGMVAQRGVRR